MASLLHGFLLAACIGWACSVKIGNKSKFDMRDTTEFIRSYGYPAEGHKVNTKDGYILEIFRIPHGVNGSVINGPIVLLQHGIVLNSESWVLRGPKKDLAFLLSDAGYDVWLSNSRGTAYSRHIVYSTDDPEFWDYGVTETGTHDLSAVIDHILNYTGKNNLTYIGHSRGNSMLVILLSIKPEYNSKINLYLGLAPVIYSRNIKSLLFRPVNTPQVGSSSNAVQKLMKEAHINNVLGMNNIMGRIVGIICNSRSALKDICSSLFFLINGDDKPMLDDNFIPLFASRFKKGLSGKEYVHLLQIAESDIFRSFDYGKEGNTNVYGNAEPPTFNISNVRIPTYLYYGPNDFFVTERNLFRFALELPNLKEIYRIPFQKFNHVDYMFARISNDILYPHILKTIAKYNKRV